MKRHLRVALRPAIALPVLLAAALLIAAFKLGDLGSVIGRIQAMPVKVMLYALLLGIAYLALKFWQLRLLLRDLRLHPDWRQVLLAFTVGELALTLPFGVFAQNWVLTARTQLGFARTSAATIVMLLVETLVVLIYLAVVGAPRWPELSPLAGLCAAGLVAVVFVTLRFDRKLHQLSRRVRQPLLHRALLGLLDLVMGLKRLSSPRVLLVNIAIAALYLSALTLAFTLVGHGVGLGRLDFVSATGIYAFSLAGVLLVGGLISQIGTVEVLGMGVAQAWGFGFTDGLALMLGFRLVWTGAMWLLNLPTLLVLWHRVPAVRSASVDDLEEAADRPRG